jgi:hypothetical protein
VLVIAESDGDYLCFISNKVLGQNNPFKACMAVETGNCQVVGISRKETVEGDTTTIIIERLITIGEGNPNMWVNPLPID